MTGGPSRSKSTAPTRNGSLTACEYFFDRSGGVSAAPAAGTRPAVRGGRNGRNRSNFDQSLTDWWGPSPGPRARLGTDLRPPAIKFLTSCGRGRAGRAGPFRLLNRRALGAAQPWKLSGGRAPTRGVSESASESLRGAAGPLQEGRALPLLRRRLRPRALRRRRRQRKYSKMLKNIGPAAAEAAPAGPRAFSTPPASAAPTTRRRRPLLGPPPSSGTPVKLLTRAAGQTFDQNLTASGQIFLSSGAAACPGPGLLAVLAMWSNSRQWSNSKQWSNSRQ